MPENINLRVADKALDEEIEPSLTSQLDDLDRHSNDIPSATSPAQLAPVPVAVDNKSAEFSVNDPETSQRTRHPETRYFKVRDYVRQQYIRVRHIGTDVHVNALDFFTKALARIFISTLPWLPWNGRPRQVWLTHSASDYYSAAARSGVPRGQQVVRECEYIR